MLKIKSPYLQYQKSELKMCQMHGLHIYALPVFQKYIFNNQGMYEHIIIKFPYEEAGFGAKEGD